MFLLDLKTLLLMTKFWNFTWSTISEILFEGVNSNEGCLDISFLRFLFLFFVWLYCLLMFVYLNRFHPKDHVMKVIKIIYGFTGRCSGLLIFFLEPLIFYSIYPKGYLGNIWQLFSLFKQKSCNIWDDVIFSTKVGQVGNIPEAAILKIINPF